MDDFCRIFLDGACCGVFLKPIMIQYQIEIIFCIILFCLMHSYDRLIVKYGGKPLTAHKLLSWLIMGLLVETLVEYFARYTIIVEGPGFLNEFRYHWLWGMRNALRITMVVALTIWYAGRRLNWTKNGVEDGTKHRSEPEDR